eukprot:TRINITY_DN24874_c0_g1_i1.p1 TRINITY_DN24874_c0_g1~~TRINITY_DN24874_c0_g1_i1.p1  ORF type:complete len:114 (-),score=24.33 TRINITY_DN24874_c0_g1_i1:57-398(-)
MQRGLVGSEMCIRDSHKYGDTLEQIPESARPHRQKFFDCYFQPHLGLEFCMKHFTDMVRTIYRQPGHKSVSYTHLTLPTILLVQISVVAVSLKKKKIHDRTVQQHVITHTESL